MVTKYTVESNSENVGSSGRHLKAPLHGTPDPGTPDPGVSASSAGRVGGIDSPSGRLCLGLSPRKERLSGERPGHPGIGLSFLGDDSPLSLPPPLDS